MAVVCRYYSAARAVNKRLMTIARRQGEDRFSRWPKKWGGNLIYAAVLSRAANRRSFLIGDRLGGDAGRIGRRIIEEVMRKFICYLRGGVRYCRINYWGG